MVGTFNRIAAINNWNGCTTGAPPCLVAQPPPINVTPPPGQNWLGAQTTVQRWYADELTGCVDGSVRIAERLQGQHPDTVRVVSHPGRENRGTGPSRRLGIRSAHGALIASLDADDVWERTHL